MHRHRERIEGCVGGYLSFSWYCRRPVTLIVAGATAARTGEAMFGRAAVARTRPAWAGTAAATLLNIAKVVCGFSVVCGEVCRWASMGVNGSGGVQRVT